MATFDPSTTADPPGSNDESKNAERAVRGHSRHTAGTEYAVSEANITQDTGASIPWPGSDFRLNQILPGSVYLWACGEHGEGDDAPNVSRPECCAGWVILITQFLCYTELWAVSGNRPPSGSQAFAEYSILAIAVAMFLLLSIASADLWGGLALVWEGRGSGNFILLTPRRTFGVCLLLTFGALVGASTRVLFYSSLEDVELVVGAAAVLFIADVDEKAMTVLKSVKGTWRLFWVLEAIGLSFGLALLVIKLTGNDETLRGKRSSCKFFWWASSCSIYDWWFILNIYPIAVTVLALVAVRAISRPDISLVVRVLRPPSRNWICFSLVSVVWVSMQVLFRWDAALPLFSESPIRTGPYAMTDSSIAGLSLLGLVLLLGGIALFVRCDYCRKLKLAYTRGSLRFRPVDRRRRRWLFMSGIGVFLAEFIFNYALDEYYGTVYWSWIGLLLAFHSMATSVWLIFGMELADLRSPSCLIVDAARALQPPLRSMLLGWSSYEGIALLHMWLVWAIDNHASTGHDALFLFAEKVAGVMWNLMLGTLLWGWTLEVRDIAYWYVATILVSNLAVCGGTWSSAVSGRVVT